MIKLKHIHRASWYWLLAYWLIAILIILVAVALRIIFDLPTANQLNLRLVESPAFVKSLPVHWLANVVVWYFFCRQYLKKIRSEKVEIIRSEIKNLAVYWMLISMVVDLVFWVVLPTPLQLTEAQLTSDFGLWFALTYPAILLGTFLGGYSFIRQFKTEEPLPYQEQLQTEKRETISK